MSIRAPVSARSTGQGRVATGLNSLASTESRAEQEDVTDVEEKGPRSKPGQSG